MSSERTVAPSPARVRRAVLAGFRPSSALLPVGLSMLGWALVAHLMIGEPPTSGGLTGLASALASHRLDAQLLQTIVVGAVRWGGVAVVLTVGAEVIAGWVSGGRLGPRDRHDIESLGPDRVRGLTAFAALLTAVLVAWTASRLSPALAGAARAPAVSASGLTGLWAAWLVRGPALVGLGLVVVGLVEVVVARRAYVRALYQTVDESRREAARGQARGTPR